MPYDQQQLTEKMEARLKNQDEFSGNENLILSTYEKQAMGAKKRDEFDEVMQVVKVAQDVYMSTNKSFSATVTDLIEALQALQTKVSQETPAS